MKVYPNHSVQNLGQNPSSTALSGSAKHPKVLSISPDAQTIALGGDHFLLTYNISLPERSSLHPEYVSLPSATKRKVFSKQEFYKFHSSTGKKSRNSEVRSLAWHPTIYSYETRMIGVQGHDQGPSSKNQGRSKKKSSQPKSSVQQRKTYINTRFLAAGNGSGSVSLFLQHYGRPIANMTVCNSTLSKICWEPCPEPKKLVCCDKEGQISMFDCTKPLATDHYDKIIGQRTNLKKQAPKEVWPTWGFSTVRGSSSIVDASFSPVHRSAPFACASETGSILFFDLRQMNINVPNKFTENPTISPLRVHQGSGSPITPVRIPSTSTRKRRPSQNKNIIDDQGSQIFFHNPFTDPDFSLFQFNSLNNPSTIRNLDLMGPPKVQEKSNISEILLSSQPVSTVSTFYPDVSGSLPKKDLYRKASPLFGIRPVQTIRTGFQNIYTIAWHPNNEHWLASGGDDNSVLIWDIRFPSTTLRTVETLAATVQHLAWRPGFNHQLATLSSVVTCNQIHIWDICSPSHPLLVLKSGSSQTVDFQFSLHPSPSDTMGNQTHFNPAQSHAVDATKLAPGDTTLFQLSKPTFVGRTFPTVTAFRIPRKVIPYHNLPENRPIPQMYVDNIKNENIDGGLQSGAGHLDKKTESRVVIEETTTRKDLTKDEYLGRWPVATHSISPFDEVAFASDTSLSKLEFFIHYGLDSSLENKKKLVSEHNLDLSSFSSSKLSSKTGQYPPIDTDTDSIPLKSPSFYHESLNSNIDWRNFPKHSFLVPPHLPDVSPTGDSVYSSSYNYPLPESATAAHSIPQSEYSVETEKNKFIDRSDYPDGGNGNGSPPISPRLFNNVFSANHNDFGAPLQFTKHHTVGGSHADISPFSSPRSNISKTASGEGPGIFSIDPPAAEDSTTLSISPTKSSELEPTQPTSQSLLLFPDDIDNDSELESAHIGKLHTPKPSLQQAMAYLTDNYLPPTTSDLFSSVTHSTISPMFNPALSTTSIQSGKPLLGASHHGFSAIPLPSTSGSMTDFYDASGKSLHSSPASSFAPSSSASGTTSRKPPKKTYKHPEKYFQRHRIETPKNDQEYFSNIEIILPKNLNFTKPSYIQGVHNIPLSKNIKSSIQDSKMCPKSPVHFPTRNHDGHSFGNISIFPPQFLQLNSPSSLTQISSPLIPSLPFQKLMVPSKKPIMVSASEFVKMIIQSFSSGNTKHPSGYTLTNLFSLSSEIAEFTSNPIIHYLCFCHFADSNFSINIINCTVPDLVDLILSKPQSNLQWIYSLYELCSRYQQWIAGAEIAKLVFEMWNVDLNNAFNASKISVGCSDCKRSELRNGRDCPKCKEKVRCSICDLPVRGIIAWCRSCQHGGHLNHIKDFFSLYQMCPTGCGCICVFEMIS